MKRSVGLYLALIGMGAAWGALFLVSKIAVSGGYKPFGIMVWQLAIGVVLSGILTRLRGRSLAPSRLVSRRYFWLFFGVAMLGTVVPNYFSYTAVVHLPAGIMAIVIAMVPLFAMPIALLMGFERAAWIRFAGTGMGALGVMLLIGPGTNLPGVAQAIYVLVALGAPLAYAGEGNFIAWYGGRGLDPLQILFGACVLGELVALPLSLASGQFISPFHVWQAPDWAIVFSSAINWLTYAGYVWLIGRAGPVFAGQVAYLVTGFGMIWAMVLLDESYPVTVWGALALMFVGIFLVQPRDPRRGAAQADGTGAAMENDPSNQPLVPADGVGKDAR